MQFEHAHGFRPQVHELLASAWPEASEAWVRLGAELNTVEIGGTSFVAVRSRRRTYERALRAAAARQRGLELRVGHVEELVERGGRVSGVVIDGVPLEADLVVDASGRGTRHRRAGDELGSDCGIAYVNRTYRLHAGADLGPLTNPIGWFGEFQGYTVLLFPHEQRHFSVVIVRPTSDEVLPRLRQREVFDAACRAIPGLDTWTDPARSAPTGDVLTGVRLRNVFRRQHRLDGFASIGDAVATTTPTAGRGVALCSMQVAAFVGLLDDGADPTTIAEPFDEWCVAHVRPWVVDHIATDTEAARRLEGTELDPSGPLTSAAVVAAGRVDERILDLAAGFITMTDLPASLAPAEPLARTVYATGWRPPFSAGPTRDELVDVIEAAEQLAAA